MKNLTIATNAILLFCISLFAQAPDTLWTKTYGGGAADLGNYVQQTADFGYIIAGSTASFGTGNTDIYLIKTNYLGDTLWTKTYGGNNAEVAYSVQMTSDGGYIIVGQTASFGAGGNDVYLIKTNGSGDVTWTKTYGGAGNDRGASVKQTNDGGYIISGTKYTSVSVDDDVYIIKTDSLGNTIWTRIWDRPDAHNGDRGGEIQLTDDGGYIMVGHSYNSGGTGIKVTLLKLNSSGTIEWWKAHGIDIDQRGSSVIQTDDGEYVFTGYTGLANPDFWIAKTNNSGNIIWSNRISAPNADYPAQLWQTSDSGFVIVGYTTSYGAGGNDVWLVKTDQLGNQLWNKTFGGIGDDYGASVQQTASRGFIIAGRTNSSGAGNSDVWLIKLSPEKNLMGWTLQNSGITDWLWGVSYVSVNLCFAVGEYGTILKTTNGGATWIQQTSGTSNLLSSVSFANANIGTAAGHNGTILKTTNGGASWETQTSGTTNSLWDIYFTDENNGTAVGIIGTILRTTNGGLNWLTQTSGTTQWLYGVCFIDANTGTVVGSSGTILKTTNGGMNWTPQTSGTSNSLWDVDFSDSNTGTAVGTYGTILRTTNGGTTWLQQTCGFNNFFYGVNFTSTNTGTLVGDNGTIFRTTNAGSTWIQQSSGTTMTLFDVSFIDANNGSVVGENGTIVGSIALFTTFQLTVPIVDGWNMVSVPGLHPNDQNVLTWWPYKDPTANVFKYSGGYQSVTIVTPGQGYYMRHNGIRLYNTGDEWPESGILVVPHDPLSVTAGWNMIGGYDYSIPTISLATAPPGLISGPIYKYLNGYQVATTLDPGYGYWAKLIGAGQIIIPEGLSKGTSQELEYIKDDWGKIIITDNSGKSYTLYVVTGEVNLNDYELPPLPPPGMFDIRYGSGRFAEDLRNSVQTIELSGIEHPIKVKVENMNIKLQDVTEKIVNTELKPGEDLVISDNSIFKLMILSGEVYTPKVYLLEQNYPNPFNPVTTIKFSVPEATNVTLAVYNTLGERVTELINAKLETGRYSYKWDARNFASGVYIYELRTDKFVSVKKMVLLK